MKTAYYTFTTWNGGSMAAGFDSAVDGPRQSVMTRQPEGRSDVPGGGKVIDLNAWRAANLDEFPPEPDGPGGESGGPEWEAGTPDEPYSPAPRVRRSHRAMLTAELISTLCVAAVAVALIVRVLTF